MKEQRSPFLNGKTDNVHRVFKANDRSYFALLKKEIHAIAAEAGFSERKIGHVDIIVAELTSNLIKHAGGGEIWVKFIEENQLKGLEIICVDNGPGIANVNKMISDGTSTKSTLGIGLGAIKRQADFFQVYSLKDWGTVLLARVLEKERPLHIKPPRLEIKSIVMPKPGEEECGDGFYSTVTNDYIKLFLGDGLGHGADAAYAVQMAGESFLQSKETDPVDIIRDMNTGVKKTRGLVGTVVVFDVKEKCWRLCGVGNIACRLSGPTFSKQYSAYNGIIGLNVPRTLNVQQINYERGQQIILCSDGIKSRWDLLKYTGILRYDLSILASALIKDFGRNTDDTSVAVCKINL